MTVTLYGKTIRLARRGDRPAITADGKHVLGCFPGYPKEIVFVPVEDLPF